MKFEMLEKFRIKSIVEEMNLLSCRNLSNFVKWKNFFSKQIEWLSVSRSFALNGCINMVCIAQYLNNFAAASSWWSEIFLLIFSNIQIWGSFKKTVGKSSFSARFMIQFDLNSKWFGDNFLHFDIKFHITKYVRFWGILNEWKLYKSRLLYIS